MTTTRTLLRYPEAIPDRKTLLDQVLWADQVSAIWPGGEPTPLTDQQEQTMPTLRRLYEEHVFVPRFMEERDIAFAVKELGRTPVSALDGSSSGWSNAFRQDFPAQTSVDEPRAPMTEDEAEEFLHYGKLDDATVKKLLQQGLLEEGEFGMHTLVRGYRARVAGLVGTLVSHGAQSIRDREGKDLELVPGDFKAIREVAEPKMSGRTALAIAMRLPALPAVNPNSDLDELLETRNKSSFREAREEYLEHLRELQETTDRILQFAGLSQDDREQQLAIRYAESVVQEVNRASASIWKSLTAERCIQVGVQVAGLIVSTASSLQAAPSAIRDLGMGLNVAGVAVPLLVRPRSPAFLRMTRGFLTT